MEVRDGWRLLWRGVDAVQVGVDPPGAVILEGLTARERDFLLSLGDGPLPPPSDGHARAVIDLLRCMGVLADDATESPDGPDGHEGAAPCTVDDDDPRAEAAALSRQGLDPGPVLRRRRGRTVTIDGLGTIGALVARGLAEAGLARLHLRADARVLASPRPRHLERVLADEENHLAARLRRHHPGLEVTLRGPAWVEPPPADLTILVRPWSVDLARAGRLTGTDNAHLAVVVGDLGVEVGPLVVPGRTACLRCVALERTRLDPAWPALATQLGAAPAPPPPWAVSRQAAGLAVHAALAHLDGRPGGLLTGEGITTSVRLSSADLLGVRTPWLRRAECGCGGVEEAVTDGRPAMSA